MKLVVVCSADPKSEYEAINKEQYSEFDEACFYLADHVKNVLTAAISLPETGEDFVNTPNDVKDKYIAIGGSLKDTFDIMMQEYIEENCDDCDDFYDPDDCDDDCENCHECDDCEYAQECADDKMDDFDDLITILKPAFDMDLYDENNNDATITMEMTLEEYNAIKHILDQYEVDEEESE